MIQVKFLFYANFYIFETIVNTHFKSNSLTIYQFDMRKNICFLFIFLVASQIAFAQMNAFTILRSDYVWDSGRDQYVLSSEDDKVVTLFEFKKDMSGFTHTTPTITSEYIINDFEKDQRTGAYELKIKSDAGNYYTMEYDVAQKIIKIFGTSGAKKFMITHKVYRAWIPEY